MTHEGAFTLEVVAPVFPVTDIRRALGYYTEKLLFTVDFQWADTEDGPLNYAILRQGNTELHLTSAKAPHKTLAYFFVDGVQAYCDALKARGAKIAHDIEDQPWEMREFEAVDPDGNSLIFGEHLSRIREETDPGD